MKTLKKEKTKRLEGNKILKSLPLVMVVILLITITFKNEFSVRFPSDYLEFRKQYSKIIKERDSKYETLVKGTILETEFSTIKNESNSKLKIYTKEKKERRANISVLGYVTPKAFWLQISFPIFSFVVLILGLIFVKIIKDNKTLKKIALRVIYPLLFVSGYWTVWSLLWFKINGKYDIPDWILYLSIAFSSILIIFITKYLIKFFQDKENKLTKIIRLISRFMIVDAKKHVKPASMTKYKKEYIDVLKKGM